MNRRPHILLRGGFWVCSVPEHGELGEWVGTTPTRAYAFWFEAVGCWLKMVEEFQAAFGGKFGPSRAEVESIARVFSKA